LNLRLLPLCLLAAALMGCRNEASTAKAPATPSGDSAIQVAQARSVEPSASASAQEPANPGEPVELKVTVLAPKITVEKTVLDLGEIGTDTKRSGEFRFTNTGNAPLKILQFHSCCGVATRGVEAGQEYAPGESGALEFDYLTGSTPVPSATRELRLQTNDPEQTLVSLTIKAAVVRRVEHSPQRFRLFLKMENAGCEDITLRSLDNKPFSIASFKSTANAISAEFDPNVEATRFVLKPKADLEKIQRNLRGMISIELTHPECGNVRVPFDVLPEFTINPAQLMVFNLRPEQAVSREVWILSNYRDEFEIDSVSSQKGVIQLVGKEKVNNRYKLRVEITAPAREGENTMVADVLEVKIKDGETVSIPFRGFYAGG
jgi:hypothetical protein